MDGFWKIFGSCEYLIFKVCLIKIFFVLKSSIKI